MLTHIDIPITTKRHHYSAARGAEALKWGNFIQCDYGPTMRMPSTLHPVPRPDRVRCFYASSEKQRTHATHALSPPSSSSSPPPPLPPPPLHPPFLSSSSAHHE